jgi:hypothetical protein
MITLAQMQLIDIEVSMYECIDLHELRDLVCNIDANDEYMVYKLILMFIVAAKHVTSTTSVASVEILSRLHDMFDERCRDTIIRLIGTVSNMDN